MNVLLRGVCRNLRHVSTHNPTVKKMFCHTCESDVLETDNRICMCCGERAGKKKSYYITRWILNNNVKAYCSLVKGFTKDPTKAPVTIYAKHKYVTYAVPLACAALYYEMKKSGELPDWTDRVFSSKEVSRLKEKGVVAFIESKIDGVGIF